MWIQIWPQFLVDLVVNGQRKVLDKVCFVKDTDWLNFELHFMRNSFPFVIYWARSHDDFLVETANIFFPVSLKKKLDMLHMNDIYCIPSVQPPFYSRDIGEMYDGILHKPLMLPPGKSEAACSLLMGLLQKDQHRRLGAIADFVSLSVFAPY